MWRDRFSLVLTLILVSCPFSVPALAQQTPEVAAEEEVDLSEVDLDDPYQAYEAGRYDRALSGFVDQQVEHPDDARVKMNLGSSHFKLNNLEQAANAFQEATRVEDAELSAQAHYNLGNVNYRQGQLQEAIEAYKKALELDPDDVDSKFNLEFVQRELERRKEQNQQRQNDQQNQEDEQQNSDQQNSDQQNSDQQSSDQENADQQSPKQDQEQQNQQGDQQDSDQDGLSDKQEEEGSNPTNPENPDTDGDGLEDGQEDQNRNGEVDPGETDPNRADSDGDGVPDGQEQQQAGQSTPGESAPEGLTEDQAQAYLEALEEGRPDKQRPQGKGKKARSGKDW